MGCGERRQTESVADVAWASFWFAAALAAHVASLLLVPLLACLAWIRRGNSFKRFFTDAGLLLFFGLLVPGLFDMWSVVKYGAQERIAHNPTILYRGETDLTWVTLYSSFFGWDVPQIVWSTWTAAAYGTGAMGLLARGFYTVSFWVHLMTGTFSGLLLPILLAARKTGLKQIAAVRNAPLFWPVAAVIAATLVGHSSLVVQVTYPGSTQVGLTGLCLMLVTWLGFVLKVENGDALSRRVLAINLALGAVPFVLMQGLVLGALNLPVRISGPIRGLLEREDEDAGIVRKWGMTTIGDDLFPAACLAAVFIFGLGIYFLRRKKPGHQW